MRHRMELLRIQLLPLTRTANDASTLVIQYFRVIAVSMYREMKEISPQIRG